MRTAAGVTIVLGFLLAACQPRDEVIGSPELPAEFGPPVKARAGCPDIGGRYAWPFVAGHAQGFDPDGRMETRRHPEFFRLAMPARADGGLEVHKEHMGTHDDLHFVMRPVAPRQGPQPPKPSEARFRDARWHCDGPWLRVTGRSQSLNPFGGNPIVRLKVADQVRWYWSRYARQPDG